MESKLRAKTFSEEKVAVFKRVTRYVGPNTLIGQLTSVIAMKHFDKEAQKRTGSAVNKDRKNLIEAWNWGVKHLRLPIQNPFSLTDKHPVDERPKYIPTLEEAYRVINAANSHLWKLGL